MASLKILMPDIDSDSDLTIGLSEQSSPVTHSGRTSPTLEDTELPLNEQLQSKSPDNDVTPTKKKKKKKPKKSATAKAKEAAAKAKAEQDALNADGRPPVLCISRNKHWKYISSYHGPWLQLPLELLESLLVLNLDPATPESNNNGNNINNMRSITSGPPPSSSAGKQRDRGFHSLGDHNNYNYNHSPPPDSLHSSNPYSLPPLFPPPKSGKAPPPPIDPGVFRSVTSIRRLIDEAAALSVRASSGLSASELGGLGGGGGGGGMFGGGGGMNGSWGAAQGLGLNPSNLGGGGGSGNGRNVAMSAMRVHRLRVLAVQKLAQAYKTDEIASSVMVMQGGSVFDDVAARVLKVDPGDPDARYVHFFHEKIPSRQLAESTDTRILDELIAANPQHLEYYRTRGIVHCFRDEYQQATKDFTFALKEARAQRKARLAHHPPSNVQPEPRTKKKKGGKSGRTNGQAPPDGTCSMDGGDGSGGGGGEGDPAEPPLQLHPSALRDAPEPIEPQLLFLRGAAYLQHAMHLIESAVLDLEGVEKVASPDGAELRLSYLENGKYGGVEVGNPDGPLGRKDGEKVKAYRSVLAQEEFRETVMGLVRKSIRDHEKFLGHFDSLDGAVGGEGIGGEDLASQAEYAFLLSESIRPGNHGGGTTPPLPSSYYPSQQQTPRETMATFTTYHPLLVESHFSVLICLLMLANFRGAIEAFKRTACVVDGLEGYPVFLPPRSMGQAEFIEVLERLASGWKTGWGKNTGGGSGGGGWTQKRGKGKLLAIESAPIPAAVPDVLPEHQGSSSATPNSASSSTSSPSISPSPPSPTLPSTTPNPSFLRPDSADALDCIRILLAPVIKRQRERSEVKAITSGAGGGAYNLKNSMYAKPVPINIPLHGPRVEVILAWLGAVHLPELEA